MIVAIVLASVAVLAAVVLLAMGKGGALSEAHPDHPPLTFSPDRALDPDAPPPRLPHGLWGYHVKITDEALGRLVRALAERDQRIALLEQQLLMRGRERGMAETEPSGDPATDRAAHPPTEPAPGSVAGPVNDPATDQATDWAEPAASTMPDFIGGQAPYSAPPAPAARSPYGEHYDAERSPSSGPSFLSPPAPASSYGDMPSPEVAPSYGEAPSPEAAPSYSYGDAPSYGDAQPGPEGPPSARWWLDSAPSPETAADDEPEPRHEMEHERGWAPVDRPEASAPTGWAPRSAYQDGPAGVPSGGWGDEPGPVSPPAEPSKGSPGGSDEPAGYGEQPGGSDADAPDRGMSASPRREDPAG